MPILPTQNNLSEPTYEDLRTASLAKLRGTLLPEAQRISQSVRAAGVRTSGIGLLPGLEAERNRTAAEAGLESSIAGQRLGQLGTLEQMRLKAEQDKELARLTGDLQNAAAARLGQQQITGALIGGVAGAAGSYLGGPGFASPVPKATPAINRYLTGEVRGNYGQ